VNVAMQQSSPCTTRLRSNISLAEAARSRLCWNATGYINLHFTLNFYFLHRERKILFLLRLAMTEICRVFWWLKDDSRVMVQCSLLLGCLCLLRTFVCKSLIKTQVFNVYLCIFTTNVYFHAVCETVVILLLRDASL